MDDTAPLPVERYVDQARRWPAAGRCVLAHQDAGTLIVYQAYRPSIGSWAVAHGRLGGPDFRMGRMSWIKPGFAWMMYRSAWGTAPGQEVVLGLRIPRAFFAELLAAAVPSTFDPAAFTDREAWRAAVASSQVRVQWDPDHGPTGRALERRSVQLGLRGAMLERFATREILQVVDMSAFVASQREWARRGDPRLLTPRETVLEPDAVG